MPKAYKVRELVKKLKRHDKGFEIWPGRGKGSHRILYHPDVNGEPMSYTLPCHNEGADIQQVHINYIRKRFRLPPDFF